LVYQQKVISTYVDPPYKGWSISNENQCIRLEFFHNLYISKKTILYEHIMGLLWIWRHCNLWRHRPLNGNDLQHQCKPHWMMHSRQHKNKTDDSYWGFGRYCVQGDLIVWSQSRQQFVGQSQICGLDCSTRFMAGHVGLTFGPLHIEGFHVTN